MPCPVISARSPPVISARARALSFPLCPLLGRFSAALVAVRRQRLAADALRWLAAVHSGRRIAHLLPVGQFFGSFARAFPALRSHCHTAHALGPLAAIDHGGGRGRWPCRRRCIAARSLPLGAFFSRLARTLPALRSQRLAARTRRRRTAVHDRLGRTARLLPARILLRGLPCAFVALGKGRHAANATGWLATVETRLLASARLNRHTFTGKRLLAWVSTGRRLSRWRWRRRRTDETSRGKYKHCGQSGSRNPD